MLPLNGFFSFTNHINAVITGKMLTAAGLNITVHNDLVLHRNFSVKVVGECSALFVGILPFAFFLSYPSRMGDTVAGICIGVPLLFIFNLFRIAFVFLVGLTFPKVFPWVHLYLGQVGMILVVAWICLMWLKYITGSSIKEDGKKESGRIGKGTRMILFAFAASIVPFAAWIWLSKPYTWLILTLAVGLLKAAGFTAVLPQTLSLYPHTFVSFNIVVVLGLVLADRVLQKTITPAGFVKAVSVLILLHLAFQMLPILFFQNHMIQSQWLINILLVVHQFFLPFIFWMVLIPMPDKSRKEK